jgi:hypothetical protein
MCFVQRSLSFLSFRTNFFFSLTEFPPYKAHFASVNKYGTGNTGILQYEVLARNSLLLVVYRYRYIPPSFGTSTCTLVPFCATTNHFHMFDRTVPVNARTGTNTTCCTCTVAVRLVLGTRTILSVELVATRVPVQYRTSTGIRSAFHVLPYFWY